MIQTNYTEINRREKSDMPASLNWHITSRCNCGCIFCYARHRAEEIVNEKRIDEILEHAADIGIKKISFVGGEPLLHEKLQYMLMRTKELGMITSIVSNGTLMDDVFLDSNGDFIDWIGLSVDSSKESTEISLRRGFGNHVRMISELSDNIKDRGIRLKLNTTVTHLNYDEDMSDYILSIHPDRWKVFQYLHIKGQNDMYSDKLNLSSEEFEIFKEKNGRTNSLGVPTVFENNFMMTGSYLMLMPNGRIIGNDLGTYRNIGSFLNVSKRDVFDIVNSEKFYGRDGDYYVDRSQEMITTRRCEMKEAEFNETGRMYQRHWFNENDMQCPVDNLNVWFRNIFEVLGVQYEPQEDEWKWEDYLDEMNTLLQKKLNDFHAACLFGGIPQLFVNMFSNGEHLFITLTMGIITYPSSMNTGALFNWLKDFVLGSILSPEFYDGPIHIKLNDDGLTTLETKMIADMIEAYNEMYNGDRYVMDDFDRGEEVTVFIDLDYLDALKRIDYKTLSERIHSRYDCCKIKAYTSSTHRDERFDFLKHGMELVSVIKPPEGFKGYDSSYKLVIDATDAIRTSDRIVVVSGDRNMISLCIAVHRSAKQIDFILPDNQTDVNFFRLADKVLDLELNDYKMGAKDETVF